MNAPYFKIEETFELAKQFAKTLSPNDVVCFFGTLGAGKTTFIKGLVEEAAGCPKAQVSSPTFTTLHIYEGKQTIYHFDLYRLPNAEEFLHMGFDEYFTAGGICCIEWPERILPYLPANIICVSLEHVDEKVRKIEITYGKNG